MRWFSRLFSRAGTLADLQPLGDELGLKPVAVLLQRNAHKLAAGPHPSLMEKLLQDGFDSAFRNLQAAGDFLVRQARQDASQDLGFPFGESGHGVPFWGSLVLEHGRQAALVQPDSALHHAQDAAGEHLG